MSYTFLKECKIVLYYQDRGYLFDALSNISLSQTFARQEYSRKTLHNKKSRKSIISNNKNTYNFSLDILCTDTYAESVLFELIGLYKEENFKFYVPDNIDIVPKTCEVFIISENDVFKLSDCAVQSIDIYMSIDNAISMNVSFSGPTVDRTLSLPSFENLYSQGNPLGATPMQAEFNGTSLPSIIDSSLNLQQEITWDNKRTLHEIGTITHAKRPYINTSSLSMTINTYLKNNFRTPDEPFYANVGLSQSGISLDIRNALINKRFTPEEVFKESYDIIITDKTTKAVVEYGGILI